MFDLKHFVYAVVVIGEVLSYELTIGAGGDTWGYNRRSHLTKRSEVKETKHKNIESKQIDIKYIV